MLRPTYASVRDKVERELDLQEETFILPEELMGYCNDAIDEAEAEIHKLNEEYFLNDAPLALVQGEDEYDLPADIYADKIRGIIYSSGDLQYEIKRVKTSKKFRIIADIQQYGASNYYGYFLKNPPGGVKLVLLPASRETSSLVATIWYIRNAARVTVETDEIDIPEFVNFIYAYMKWMCYFKEGHPNTPDALAALEKQRALMTQTLTDAVPDDDNAIEMDMSSYQDMS